MRLRKSCLILSVQLLCAALCLSACEHAEGRSLEFAEGEYQIDGSGQNPFFTPQSKITLSWKEPPDKEGAFKTLAFKVAEIPPIWFEFDTLADGIVSVAYNHLKMRRVSFDVSFADGSQKGFSLYAYDWSKKIHLWKYDFCFVKI